MQVVDRNRFSAFWRLGWQLDDNHQLTLGQLYDVSGRYGQLWYMEHSLPLPVPRSLNLWLTRGSQAHMAAYGADEGLRDWGSRWNAAGAGSSGALAPSSAPSSGSSKSTIGNR